MTFNRRAFFAALVAPFLKRFWPKPKPIVIPQPETPWWIVSETWDHGLYIMKARPLELTTVQECLIIHKKMSPYWHGQLPFVKLELKPLPWEKRS